MNAFFCRSFENKRKLSANRIRLANSIPVRRAIISRIILGHSHVSLVEKARFFNRNIGSFRWPVEFANRIPSAESLRLIGRAYSKCFARSHAEPKSTRRPLAT